MWNEEDFITLEEEERVITEEAILFMLYLLAETKSEVEKELRSFYQKYGKNGVVTWQQARKWVGEKDHRRRLTALLTVLTDHFSELYEKLTPEFRSFLIKVIEKELNFFDVKDIEPNDEDILLKSWGVDESNWDNRLFDDTELWNVKVASDLKRSFIRQDDIETVIEHLTNSFESMERVLQKLAMTESTAVGSIVRRRIFQALGIKKYQYYAREDERTCETCGSLHGLVFPISLYEIGVTASPIHPWCRCWEVPIME